MAKLATSRSLHESFRRHLRGDVEQVGFFLADYDPEKRRFSLIEWRPVPAEGFEIQSSFHVTLTDETKAAVIKWAWDSGKCLVEAHSHGDDGLAVFSPSDLWGFKEWVPHLWWRLRGRAYAAIVIADETFDALAWIDAADHPEQVSRLAVEGGDDLAATGLTLAVEQAAEARRER
jgi:hypothetical protein